MLLKTVPRKCPIGHFRGTVFTEEHRWLAINTLLDKKYVWVSSLSGLIGRNFWYFLANQASSFKKVVAPARLAAVMFSYNHFSALI